MILLSISHGGAPPCILFLISRRGEYITPNIAASVHPAPVILFLTYRKGEDGIIPNIPWGEHLSCDIVPNIQEGRWLYYSQYRRKCTPFLWYCSWYAVWERMILLPISQEVYTPPWYCSQYLKGEDNSMPNIAGDVHFLPVILFLIFRRERMILLPILQGVYTSPVIFFSISKREEDNIPPNIAEGVQPPVILFAISRVEENDINANIAVGGHLPVKLFEISMYGRRWNYSHCRRGCPLPWYSL